MPVLSPIPSDSLSEFPAAQPPRRSGLADPGSLRGLRALVGFLVLREPAALARLVAGGGATPGTCALLFRTLAAARAEPRVRMALDALLALHVGAEARPLLGLPLSELAARWSRQEALTESQRLALLWVLHSHPCDAARRLEERVADGLLAAGFDPC